MGRRRSNWRKYTCMCRWGGEEVGNGEKDTERSRERRIRRS